MRDGIAIAHMSPPHGYPLDVCLMGEPAQYAGDTANMLQNYEANAHLIAAAPDLYAALEKAMQFVPHRVSECNGDKCRMPHCASCNGWDDAEEAMVGIDADSNAARAALAKARGQS